MKHEVMNDIIERIKQRRLELGFSYQDLASLTNMSKSTLQRYETGGIKNLPLDKLKILAQALETSPEWIMGWEQEIEKRKELDVDLEDMASELNVNIEFLEELENGSIEVDPHTVLVYNKLVHILYNHRKVLELNIQEDEIELIERYRKLNKKGKVSVSDYAKTIGYNPEYIENGEDEEESLMNA